MLSDKSLHGNTQRFSQASQQDLVFLDENIIKSMIS